MIYSCIHGELRAVVCDVSVVTAEEDLPCEIVGRSSRSHKRVEYIIRRGCELASGSNH
jgi:hypothetical protein